MARAHVEDDDELDQEIEAQVNEWSANSTECFSIELVRSDGSDIVAFEPAYTYAMFGEEEAIFGYQGLEINLRFVAHDLTPSLSISHAKVFPAQGDVQPTDIKGALRKYLPTHAFEEDGEQAITSAQDWRPPGEKIQSYDREGTSFEIWCASLADPAAKRLLENMQILAPLFIDGGSMLELEQDWTTARWKLYTLYEVESETSANNSPYVLAGYSTSYRSFTFPDRLDALDLSSPLYLPSRERLSQFLILPSHQSSGHGQALYNTMYKHLTAPNYVREFTIEDPNEDFDQLRDVCDLLLLRQDSKFRSLGVQADSIPVDKLSAESEVPTDLIIPIQLRDSLREQYKLQSRQFARLVEIQALSQIPALHRSKARITRKEKSTNQHDKEYFFWRLYTKQRLYIFNRDQISQLEASERVEKLDAALDSVVEGYQEILERVERIEKERPTLSEEMSFRNKRKRRNVVDDDDEEEDSGDVNDNEGNESERAHTGGKKPRIE
ncbi:histone acetyltransferase type B catalytic subunit [Dissoconium aciculare CBS 342.82]|uniref:Histone acetyltransferase type B catalytic subunit n=1 Tax=Dissoconium aciculare CBS 342.82 TaxID=1314786 RepID=A0A6J3M5H6_9PEZI|nr:histone acetyltransferase type B catalytic subunit [Dissoconium aciculare CBS 342.82]KAF1822087.1 histone acetyltransferase type B catalytic subunit [Dissoconium aciculare CBS 342.82]